MHVGTVRTLRLFGLEVIPTTIRASVQAGSNPLEVSGLEIPEHAFRDLRRRLPGLFQNLGLAYPNGRVVVEVSPSTVGDWGSHLELPLLLAILQAAGYLGDVSANVTRTRFLGAFSPGGEFYYRPGLFPMIAGSPTGEHYVTPKDRETLAELSNLSADVQAWCLCMEDLGAVLAFVRTGKKPAPFAAPTTRMEAPTGVQLEDIKGHDQCKRALLIAAAGGHNLHFRGRAPSIQLMARALLGLLPPMKPEEYEELLRVHYLSGNQTPPQSRPLRAPHFTASLSGLQGQGYPCRPGEFSLAHHGVLCLQDVTEFSRATLEVLREPITDHVVRVGHPQRVLPADFQLVTSAPSCGAGHPEAGCTCEKTLREVYRRRYPGFLADATDLTVPFPTVVQTGAALGPTTAEAKREVLEARAELAGHPNRELPMSGTGQGTYERFLRELTAVQAAKLRRVASTIAALEGYTVVVRSHVEEALTFIR